MKKIIYTREDGGLSIITPAPSWGGTIEELALKDVPKGLEYKIIEEANIPSDRYFRNAWKGNSDKVEVDIPKARIIHMDKIRMVRDEELKRLDIEQLKGVDVSAEKEVLRDLPQNFDLTGASTPEELKALFPVELPRGVIIYASSISHRA